MTRKTFHQPIGLGMPGCCPINTKSQQLFECLPKIRCKLRSSISRDIRRNAKTWCTVGHKRSPTSQDAKIEHGYTFWPPGVAVDHSEQVLFTLRWRKWSNGINLNVIETAGWQWISIQGSLDILLVFCLLEPTARFVQAMPYKCTCDEVACGSF